MKKTIIYVSLVALLLNVSLNKAFSQTKDDLEETITLSGAFALYPMAVKWADEFKRLHPKVRIDLSAGGAGKGMTDALAKIVDIGMVSREIYPEELKKGAYGIAVTKDAVVATISDKNPVLKDILSHGLKKNAANEVFITGKYKTWGQAI
ncbi:MAG TPA: substrate-binding domain-containing protein, partial [Bacteroidales bacterium]